VLCGALRRRKANERQVIFSPIVGVRPPTLLIRVVLEATAESTIHEQRGRHLVADGGTPGLDGMTRRATTGSLSDSGLYGCLGVGIPYANADQYCSYPGKKVC